MTSGIAFTAAVLASVLITYGTTGNPGLALIPAAAWLLLCLAWRHRTAITRNRAAIARVAGVLAIPPAAMGMTLLLLAGQLLAFLGAAVFLIACWLAWETRKEKRRQREAQRDAAWMREVRAIFTQAEIDELSAAWQQGLERRQR